MPELLGCTYIRPQTNSSSDCNNHPIFTAELTKGGLKISEIQSRPSPVELTSGWGSECAHPTRGLPEDPECTSTSFGDLQPMPLGGEFGSLQVRFCRLNLALSPALQNSFMSTNLLFTIVYNLPGVFRIMKTLGAFAQKKCKKYFFFHLLFNSFN